MYKNVIKRLLDVLISFVGILFFFWLFLLVAILIKLDSKGPAIFKQERLGFKGQVFKIYKFRSMCINAEKQGSGVYSMKGDTRITKVGRILRATSIDEIPQLINILRGEMSLIGPRPALTYHPWPLSKYTDAQKKMFDVRPGITGWAQVHGRKDVEWNTRIKLNIWYVDHVSFLLDCKIFFKTIHKVLSNTENQNTTTTVPTTDSGMNNQTMMIPPHVSSVDIEVLDIERERK